MRADLSKQTMQQGSVSLSGLIILCMMAVISFYIYEIYLAEANSLMVYKKGMAAKNAVVSRSLFLADVYARDSDRWKNDCKRAEKAYNFRYAPLVDEHVQADDRGEIMTIHAHLLRRDEDAYILNVQSEMWQVRLHLKEEGGEVIVQRWER